MPNDVTIFVHYCAIPCLTYEFEIRSLETDALPQAPLLSAAEALCAYPVCLQWFVSLILLEDSLAVVKAVVL